MHEAVELTSVAPCFNVIFKQTQQIIYDKPRRALINMKAKITTVRSEADHLNSFRELNIMEDNYVISFIENVFYNGFS